ncbi:MULTISPECIES: DUF5995 family protein [unclassified Streptomyces]|uniref:DUF5995 family protein n=1 Tax=unclassified Streptomyces TaxID=2593676 RepID=UPI00081E34CF|nr:MULTISPECIES: DUF5995 family protein [unclassified Streptomyces]SCD70395.1 hypothetical protein GA0115251_119410 [Streptomyces sp. TverLS-915]SCF03371.1 hypothetical protein GA0115257_10591 [Streptomyces sp. LcepLS]
MGHSSQPTEVLSGAARRVDAGVDGVLARIRGLGAGWPERDGVAVFHRVYTRVTEEVGRLVDRGGFPDRRAAVTLDVLFAERYLDAVETFERGGRAPACWRPLLHARDLRGVRPVQFALCGVNAHIGHDLALAVVDTCRTLACAPEDLRDEFDQVGELLTALEERVREDLMPGPDLLERAEPLTHLAGAWGVERAREAAWVTARALWAVRGLPVVAQEMRGRLDTGVGHVGRLLVTPLVPVRLR